MTKKKGVREGKRQGRYRKGRRERKKGRECVEEEGEKERFCEEDVDN